ncbi:hypothetical protein Pmani_029044 [Petrolisthes manimaculis]|uniref:Adenine DNA glycosylase n=1 Tax=Petrolisthes manimaculis TaxID=1843537 RepID=A0AAE1TXE3_9EUCA|nr:hypothetical protein Pmani_029044 [Petrolisthes manimaculis]
MVKPTSSPPIIGKLHTFSTHEVKQVRERLVGWYDDNKRQLPWRTIAITEPDRNIRAYAVWVSEIMLQQTQVNTVKSYFEKWMCKWPTVSDLAKATLEEVNQMWAGLGYYSRARRLHEGAIKIVQELDGEFPDDRDSLMKQLPGVGRYSGSAVASIALGHCVGVVDGNVNRVLARVKGVGADISNQSTSEHFWTLANQLVDPDRPGDFNQAMMELGATVCTPKTPNCESCPLRPHCVAFHRNSAQKRSSIATHFKQSDKKVSQESTSIPDLECLPTCDFCLRKEDWDESLGVLNYPRKAQKTKSREEVCAVVIMKCENGKMLLVQRPKAGLLANLWEFPSIPLVAGDETSRKEEERVVREVLKEKYGLTSTQTDSITYSADVVHIFSHIHQTYRVYQVSLADSQGLTWPDRYQGGQWMEKTEFLASATSTAMKKVLKAADPSEQNNKGKRKKAESRDSPLETKKQKTISQFFSAVSKKR